MTGDVSALQMVLTGDPGLFAIVRLSLHRQLVSAVLLAALIGVPVGAVARADAISRPRGRRSSSSTR